MALHNSPSQRPRPPRQLAGLRMTGLPWCDMPRGLLLLLAGIALLALVPLLRPELVGLQAAPAEPAAATARLHAAPEAALARPRFEARPAAAREDVPPRPLLIDANRLRWSPRFGVREAAALLSADPPLGSAGVEPQLVAEMVVGQGLRWGINPQLLISLLDLESGARGGLVPASTPLTPSLSLEPALERTIAHMARDLRTGLFEPPAARLLLADGSAMPIPHGIDQGSYALLRYLAGRSDRQRLQQLAGAGPSSLLASFTRRFGDPRAPVEVPDPGAPFLRIPFQGPAAATAGFDHHYPIFQSDGSMALGRTDVPLGYDGHNGWDYTMPEGRPIVAAAAGYVLFASPIDNECATRAGAVVLEHANGYRTLYWHLRSISVQAGSEVAAGSVLGENGATGCASGPHLHFGVQRLGRDVDPYGWCGSGVDPWAQHAAGARSIFLWVDQPNPCPLPEGSSVADDSHASSTMLLGAGWYPSDQGNAGSAHFTYGTGDQPQSIAVWRPLIAESGRYRCFAFVPSSAAGAGRVTYHIFYAGGSSSVVLEQGRVAGGWANLGVYPFMAGQLGHIELRDSDTPPRQPLWADAVACAREL